MRYTTLFLFLLIGMAGAGPRALAQEPPRPDDAVHDDPKQQRPNLFAELGLSPDQVQQIRRLNQERRPRMQQARRRMFEAQRNLDMAIYGDSMSDSDFNAQLKEFQAAEAELSKLRFESELEVRRVLTPEQLVRFREMRRRFAEARNQNQQRRQDRRPHRFPPMREGPFRRPIN